MIGYPMKLSYVAKEAVWGGSRLKEQYAKQADFDKLAETWELTVRPEEMSRVENGAFAGRTLGEVLQELGADAIAKDFSGDRFPLLLKLIDADAPLSVQVHPDDAFSLAHEGELGKTEMWYVLEAEPGAKLVYGLQPGVTPFLLAEAVSRGMIASCLHEVPVRAGDVFFIPSGMVHAIGAGIVIAELQQNSNITYRVYDYNRLGKDGKPRPLHVEKGLQVIRPYTEEEIHALRFSGGEGDGILANCSYFRADVRVVEGESTDTVGTDSFRSLLCLDGEGTICCGERSDPIRKGDSYFLPAGMGEYSVYGHLKLFVSSLPRK